MREVTVKNIRRSSTPEQCVQRLVVYVWRSHVSWSKRVSAKQPGLVWSDLNFTHLQSLSELPNQVVENLVGH